LQAPTAKFLREATKTLVNVGFKSVTRIINFTSAVEEFTKTHSDENSWKLMYIEVNEQLSHIDHIWSSVIETVLNIADDSNNTIFTFVTKEESIPILLRFGFVIIAEEFIDGELKIWGLKRFAKNKDENLSLIVPDTNSNNQ